MKENLRLQWQRLELSRLIKSSKRVKKSSRIYIMFFKELVKEEAWNL
jgi:hypothetical protein